MSTRPNRSTVAATQASACSGSPALATVQATSPAPGGFADRISPADDSSPSALRDESITEAPELAKARAMAWPIPREPPVTSAVLPSSRSSMGGQRTGGPDRAPDRRSGAAGRRLLTPPDPPLNQWDRGATVAAGVEGRQQEPSNPEEDPMSVLLR